MKVRFLMISLLTLVLLQQANAQVGKGSQAIPTLSNGQNVTVNVPPGQERFYRIWIPANAAHLKISYIAQTPNMYIFSNFGSVPVLQSGTPRPDCELPAITDELLGIPFTWYRCIFERPESGSFHYVRVFNEGISSPVGINQLTVSYVPNGLSSVANVSLGAYFIDRFTHDADFMLSTGVSSDVANYQTLDFAHDESLGEFEERAGGACDAGAPYNPSYLEMKLFISQPIQSCKIRGSWDQQWIQCSAGVVAAINGGAQSIINTNEFNTIINNGNCTPDVGNYHMRGGLYEFHWFEVQPVINGQTYYKRFVMRKVNTSL